MGRVYVARQILEQCRVLRGRIEWSRARLHKRVRQLPGAGPVVVARHLDAPRRVHSQLWIHHVPAHRGDAGAHASHQRRFAAASEDETQDQRLLARACRRTRRERRELRRFHSQGGRAARNRRIDAIGHQASVLVSLHRGGGLADGQGGRRRTRVLGDVTEVGPCRAAVCRDLPLIGERHAACRCDAKLRHVFCRHTLCRRLRGHDRGCWTLP